MASCYSVFYVIFSFPKDHALTSIASATIGQEEVTVQVPTETGCKRTVERVVENAVAVVVEDDGVRYHVPLAHFLFLCNWGEMVKSGAIDQILVGEMGHLRHKHLSTQ